MAARLRTLARNASLARRFTKNTNNYCSLGPSGAMPHINVAPGISFFAWCRYSSLDTSLGDNQLLHCHLGSADPNGFAVCVRSPASSGARLLYIGRANQFDAATSSASSSDIASFTAGAWAAVGCVANFAAGTLKLYYGGSVVHESSPPNWSGSVFVGIVNATIHDGIGTRFTSGTTTTTTNRQFDGDISHASLWNVALTDEQMLRISTGSHPLSFHPGRCLYFPLDGRFGGMECDHLHRLKATVGGDLPVVPGPPGVHDLFASAPPHRTRAPFYRRSARGFLPSVVFERLLDDEMGLGEDSEFSTVRRRIQQEGLGLVDGLVAMRLITRLIADGLGINDPQQANHTANRIVTALLGITDDEAAITISWRAIVDGLGLTDNAAVTGPALNVHTATVQAVLGMADAISRQKLKVNSRVLTDALAIADVMSRRAVWRRMATDRLGAADAQSRIHLIHRAYAEALQIATTARRISHANRSLTDAIGAIDGLSGGSVRTLPWVVVLTELMGMGTVHSQSAAYLRETFDGLGLAEDYRDLVSLLRSVADVLGVADDEEYTRLLRRPVIERLGLTDAETQSTTSRRTIADLFSLTDAADVLTIILRLVPELLGLPDEVDRTSDALRAITDLLAAGDVAQRFRSAGTEAVDGLGLSAEASHSADYHRLVSSALSLLSELGNLVPALVRMATVVDHFGLAEVLTRQAMVLRTATEALGLIDDPRFGMDRSLAITEALAFGEDVPRKVEYYRAIEDVLAVAELILNAHRSDPLRNEVYVDEMVAFRAGPEAWQVAAEV